MDRYLLDSNVLIRCLRGDLPTIQMVKQLAQEGQLYLSSVSYLEIVAGMLPREEKATYELLQPLLPIPLDNAIADMAGKFIMRYRSQGITLSLPDAAIAATTIRNNLTFVTFNRKHYPMPEIRLFGH